MEQIISYSLLSENSEKILKQLPITMNKIVSLPLRLIAVNVFLFQWKVSHLI